MSLEQVDMEPVTEPTEAPLPTPDAEAEIQQLETVSESDEVGALEEDLNASEFTTLDKDLSTLEQEL